MTLSSYLLKGSTFHGKLAGENLMAYQLATWLREQSLMHDFPFVWLHVANEISNNKSFTFGALLRAQGKFPGITDFIFLGPKTCGALELKMPKGKLSENQVLFQSWCNDKMVAHKVAYSVDESIEWIERLK